MVKGLTQTEMKLISQAIKSAENRTSAEIVTVIVPASDHYQEHIMLCGFFLGGLIDILLWSSKVVTHLPWLLFIQVAAATLLPLIPTMRTLCLPFMPTQAYQNRAAQAAGEEFHAILQQVPHSTPVLLIYISLAEHYVHVLPNTVISEKIPIEKWEVVEKNLASLIAKGSVASACITTLHETGDLLAPAFLNREDLPHIVPTEVITHIKD